MAELVHLRRFGAYDLEPVLREETADWQRLLDWDFSSSAGLVRKFADARALDGYALVEGAEIAGYGYTVLEGHKGLIGDIFVRGAWRSCETEARLFRALFDHLVASPGVRRVESQLMLFGVEAAKALQRDRFVRLFERILMTSAAGMRLPAGTNPSLQRFYLEPWADHHQEAAASVIALAYIDHVDARINDQYRSLAGARAFLHNIVQFPGCGSFFRPGSFVAFDRATGYIAGIVLSSFIAPGVAHVAQICVTPYARHTGLGYELLRQSVTRLKAAGAKRITLTVTAANSEAVTLYERCGFQRVRSFQAYVWDNC